MVAHKNSKLIGNMYLDEVVMKIHLKILDFASGDVCDYFNDENY